MAESVSFVIITGLSGAGKSHAIKCFEDMGFYCVDNLPTTLIPTFADLIARSRHDVGLPFFLVHGLAELEGNSHLHVVGVAAFVADVDDERIERRDVPALLVVFLFVLFTRGRLRCEKLLFQRGAERRARRRAHARDDERPDEEQPRLSALLLRQAWYVLGRRRNFLVVHDESPFHEG